MDELLWILLIVTIASVGALLICAAIAKSSWEREDWWRAAPDDRSSTWNHRAIDATLAQAVKNVRPIVEGERYSTTHYPPTKGA